jgi:tetratricopeptide (TPR) repeat protein
MTDDAIATGLERVRALSRHNRFRRASRELASLLEHSPDEPLLLAQKALLDVALKRTTVPDAEELLHELAADHPDVARLQIVAAVLLARRGDRTGAMTALEALKARFPANDHDIDAAIAWVLTNDSSRLNEAITLYVSALRRGANITLSERSWASRVAKRRAPSLATELLSTATPLEHAILRSRAWGLYVALLLLVGVAGAITARAYNLVALSIVLGAITVTLVTCDFLVDLMAGVRGKRAVLGGAAIALLLVAFAALLASPSRLAVPTGYAGFCQLESAVHAGFFPKQPNQSDLRRLEVVGSVKPGISKAEMQGFQSEAERASISKLYDGTILYTGTGTQFQLWALAKPTQIRNASRVTSYFNRSGLFTAVDRTDQSCP